MSCSSVGGMAHMRVQVCWHLLSRPDNTDSGSRISWRADSPVRLRWFQVPCSGPQPLVRSPLLTLVCLVSRRVTDAPTPTTRPPDMISRSVPGTTQTHLNTFRLNVLEVRKNWSVEQLSTQCCVRLHHA